MSNRLTLLPLLGLILALARPLAAEIPADQPLEAVIDAQIEARLREAGATPAAAADDTTLVRRLTLDLAGRIPTTGEAQAFVQSKEPDKRVQLVDRLLASPDFPRHQRNELDTALMPRERSDDAWRNYLLEASQQNVSWDRLFRELMLGSDDNPVQKPGLLFLRSRVENLDDLTRDTARLFFGVDISCAKCHDHPLVSDWKQDHYFGMASFFNRTYKERDRLAERDFGQVKFKTKGGEDKVARLMFLSGAPLTEPDVSEPTDAQRKQLDEERKRREEGRLPPPSPDFSRRAALVETGLAEQHFFAKAIVNRLWARFFSRGLVTPIDQMHSENPPSHPELLDALAKDVAAHGYDLRRLIRGLVLSQAYARASRWDSASDPPEPAVFGLAQVRPLSPRQYALSLVVATSSPQWLTGEAQRGEWSKRIADLENRAGSFARQIEVPEGNSFQVSVTEALLLSNGEEVEKNFLSEGDDRLLSHLKKLGDRQQMIDAAYWAVLSRAPEPEEIQAMSGYLAAREDRPAQATRQVVWALLTSAEFRFNH